MGESDGPGSTPGSGLVRLAGLGVPGTAVSVGTRMRGKLVSLSCAEHAPNTIASVKATNTDTRLGFTRALPSLVSHLLYCTCVTALQQSQFQG